MKIISLSEDIMFQHGFTLPQHHSSYRCCCMGSFKWLPEHYWQMCLGWILFMDRVRHLNNYFIHAIITAYSRGLSSLLLSSIFLIVNIMAYTGILRSGSWHEKHQNKSYKLVYPWICLYFIANCGIVPIGEYTIQSF